MARRPGRTRLPRRFSAVVPDESGVMTQRKTQTSRVAVNRLAWWIAGTGTLLLVLRMVFFETRQIVVDVQPQRIFADGQSSSAVRVLRLNRLGMTIPLSRIALRCVIEEGTDLVSSAYNADSTRLTLTALRRPGVVRMRIVTRAWPF